MGYSPASPVTGAPQTDLTSPTYTLTEDVAPNANSIQHAVTALGGTQTGVTTHKVSSPFTSTFSRPPLLRGIGVPNALGQHPSIPNNQYTLLTRKGVTPSADDVDRIASIRTVISVPAGAESYDHAEIQAMLSLHVGILYEQSDEIGDVVETGLM